MLLSHLIIALSVAFASVVQARPSRPPASSVDSSRPTAEPGTLLGRRYVVQEHREPTRLPRAASARYAGYDTAEAPRHVKPFAQYLAERGLRADSSNVPPAPNYVSHVGPMPPGQPVGPVGSANPLVAAASTAPIAPSSPSAQLNPTSASTPSEAPKQTKMAKGKSKTTHKEGKKGGKS